MNDVKNRLIATVTVELGGADRTFRLDFNGLARIEEVTGKNLLMDAGWLQGLSLRELRGITWALLSVPEGEQRPTLEEVGSWLGPGVMPVLVKMLGDLWRQNNPKPDAKKGKGGKATPFPAPPTSG
jgi:hypothetical protein